MLVTPGAGKVGALGATGIPGTCIPIWVNILFISNIFRSIFGSVMVRRNSSDCMTCRMPGPIA